MSDGLPDKPQGLKRCELTIICNTRHRHEATEVTQFAQRECISLYGMVSLIDSLCLYTHPCTVNGVFCLGRGWTDCWLVADHVTTTGTPRGAQCLFPSTALDVMKLAFEPPLHRSNDAFITTQNLQNEALCGLHATTFCSQILTLWHVAAVLQQPPAPVYLCSFTSPWHSRQHSWQTTSRGNMKDITYSVGKIISCSQSFQANYFVYAW